MVSRENRCPSDLLWRRRNRELSGSRSRSSPTTLSPKFLSELGAPAINIHHSFLPAFVGADPDRRAHERVGKLIGRAPHLALGTSLAAQPVLP